MTQGPITETNTPQTNTHFTTSEEQQALSPDQVAAIDQKFAALMSHDHTPASDEQSSSNEASHDQITGDDERMSARIDDDPSDNPDESHPNFTPRRIVQIGGSVLAGLAGVGMFFALSRGDQPTVQEILAEGTTPATAPPAETPVTVTPETTTTTEAPWTAIGYDFRTPADKEAYPQNPDGTFNFTPAVADGDTPEAILEKVFDNYELAISQLNPGYLYWYTDQESETARWTDLIENEYDNYLTVDTHVEVLDSRMTGDSTLEVVIRRVRDVHEGTTKHSGTPQTVYMLLSQEERYLQDPDDIGKVIPTQTWIVQTEKISLTTALT